MDFRLLGPFEVIDDDGEACRVPEGRLRTLCAALLLNAGTVVSADALAAHVWGNAAPQRPRDALQVLVVRLRKGLGKQVAARIATVRPGYVFTVEPGELDVQRFQDLYRGGMAAHAAGQWLPAAQMLGEALGAWRGEPLCDVPGEQLALGTVGALAEMRLDAQCTRLSARLALGHHARLVGELSALVEAWPLREQLRCDLMLALHRCGRRADALAVYQAGRRALVEELGIEPGEGLRALHHAILANDPSLAWTGTPPATATAAVGGGEHLAGPSGGAWPGGSPAAADRGEPAIPAARQGLAVGGVSPTPTELARAESAVRSAADGFAALPGSESAAGPAAPATPAPASPAPASPTLAAPPHTDPVRIIPAQLPATTADFTGRQAAVAALTALMTGGSAAGTVVISTISGMGGIGKSALAVHAAHSWRKDFPDGQLYVELRGTTAPREPSDVLGDLLTALGVAREALPAQIDARATLYRSLLAGRRFLLVLDDARDAAQVRPLLPGSESCGVLISSRSRLSALPGATRFDLAGFEEREACALLSSMVGAERVAAEPEATAMILHHCAGLPLAIRITGSRLAARPSWSLRDLADRLAGAHRLDELEVEDAAVRASFQVSYDALRTSAAATDQAAAQAFRLLGVWAGPDLSLDAAAALFGLPPARAERALEALVDAHLLESPVAGRYRLHDLMRDYAEICATDDLSEEERGTSLARMLSWYLHSADRATRLLSPVRRHLDLAEPGIPPGVPPADLRDYGEALAWCEAERANLGAAVDAALAAGMNRVCWQLAVALSGFFVVRSHWGDWERTSLTALAAAGEDGDRAAEAMVLTSLGRINTDLRHVEAAHDYYRRALSYYREVDDLAGQGRLLTNIGGLLAGHGRHREGADMLEQAVAVLRTTGEPILDVPLVNLARVLCYLGELTSARTFAEEALALRIEAGNRGGASGAMEVLALVESSLGHDSEALELMERAVAIRSELKDRRGLAESTLAMSTICEALGRHEHAAQLRSRAVAIFREIGDPQGELAAAGVDATGQVAASPEAKALDAAEKDAAEMDEAERDEAVLDAR
jgi:DNA-binding SARP family transcriptional activator/tetratricopeptide (TPR) repeat protein